MPIHCQRAAIGRWHVSDKTALPSWLVQESDYRPSSDREGFLRTNLLRLTSLLGGIREGGKSVSPLDRVLSSVPTVLRLMGVVICAACVSAATNMSFVWLVLALDLVLLAARPANQIASIAGTALVVCLVACLVMLPAVLLGGSNPSVLVRMGVKSFCTVSLVLGLTQSVSWNRLVSALSAIRLPGAVVFVADSAIRDLALLGRTASELTEALALRSVGVNHDKTSSAAGIMGVTFVHAQSLASEQVEAMACRGFDGSFPVVRDRSLTPAGVAYLAGLTVLLVLYFYLEHAMVSA